VSPPEPPPPLIPGSFAGITSVERLADTDTLVFEGERLIVRAPREMPSWHVGKNRRTAVHFRGTRYVVVGARIERGEHEYTLDPWTLRANELPARDIRYDEAYVQEREDDARAMRARNRELFALAPLWPVLGFLPSSWKRRLHERYAFMPVSTTRFSVVLEIVVAGLLLPSVVLGVAGAVPLCVFVALVVDGFVRASILIEDEYPPFGFGEWVMHKELGPVLRTGWAAVRARMRGRGPRGR
jgi:hypothetical protein